jgi:hypothetical protein
MRVPVSTIDAHFAALRAHYEQWLALAIRCNLNNTEAHIDGLIERLQDTQEQCALLGTLDLAAEEAANARALELEALEIKLSA